MVGTVLIKRICGHSSPYTFKPNERYAKDRFQKFLSKKCPQCTLAAIQALEAQQKATAAQRRQETSRHQKDSGPKADLGDSGVRVNAARVADVQSELLP